MHDLLFKLEVCSKKRTILSRSSKHGILIWAFLLYCKHTNCKLNELQHPSRKPLYWQDRVISPYFIVDQMTGRLGPLFKNILKTYVAKIAIN